MAGLDPTDEFIDYDKYSKTPPRTKILRKMKSRKSKEQGLAMPSKQVRRNVNSSNNDNNDNKRQIKLTRGSERDLKLDIAGAQTLPTNNNNNGPKPISYQIESCNHFKSLSRRTIPCLKYDKDTKCLKDSIDECCPQNRIDFYQTFSNLVKLGDRKCYREENLWQNELKDLLWLELRAYQSDRTLLEEDDYLCIERENVEKLLNDIMLYKFQPSKQSSSIKYYSTNSDSGVEDECNGCLSMYCQSCLEAQNEALRDVEKLMLRLEKIESLFPSSKAFAELYPLYNDSIFVGRVKAISLWYNMTKQQRLKLMIIGKLAKLENKNCQWPLLNYEKDNNFFNDLSTSPTDSNNSSGSSVNDFINDSKPILDIYNNVLTNNCNNSNGMCNPNSAYRNYIENILKTRTLQNAVSFLNRLHLYVLGRVVVTLEKPESDEIFLKMSCNDEIEELKRYGAWSPETQAMSLPSYRASFLFLSTVCLDVIHEFLKLRIEQKPKNPSPLSVHQLMREIKDGLKIAILQKEKYVNYIDKAINGTNYNGDGFKNKIKEYDQSLFSAFNDYLDYLEKWLLTHNNGTFQKNLLEEEWRFSYKIVQNIPGGIELLREKIIYILVEILKRSEQRLSNRIEKTLQILTINEKQINKQTLFVICREIQSIFCEEREICIKTLAFCKTLFRYPIELEDLKYAVVGINCSLPQLIERVQIIYNYLNQPILDDIEKISLIARMREIMMQCYRFVFEYYREIEWENMQKNCREKLTNSMVKFANFWIKFVIEKCERGHGMKPRWAYQGLEFLMLVCEPRNTKYLNDEQFDDLKNKIEICFSHVIGTANNSDSGIYSEKSSLQFIRTRRGLSSLTPRSTYKSQRSNNCKINIPGSPETNNKKQFVKIVTTPNSDKYLDAIDNLEYNLDEKLRQQGLIGKVVSFPENRNKYIRKKYVTFTWQRGIKIGQGRFGKVYTAVNNNTGEMMAVKEIALHNNDTIKRLAEEIKILEGITHKNLVRYYGVEVHKEEMLLFMEFCAEGTLENLVAASENGLSELLVRRYTFQLVSGVACLHDHGIVHRDIKTANIFLTDSGNCLKIGDFGCAVKIKAQSTMPGELQGFVGTQAYMAPEVFTKNEGHGRAADIWSVGCVVVEMSSGKRPWSQFDSNYQIMFKVGMGQHPDPPDNMTDEGLTFLEMCFKHNPHERATAHDLLGHCFVIVSEDL